jgi:uncharacterized iron-regulated membrane protein
MENLNASYFHAGGRHIHACGRIPRRARLPCRRHSTWPSADAPLLSIRKNEMTDMTLSRTGGDADASAARSTDTSFKAFITRLHFYVGLFVGPFVLIAAITGTLYVLTPQIEQYIYRDQLLTASTGEAQPLAAQAEAARKFIGEGPRLFAVRPAPTPGQTTRVMFTEPGLGDSESRAIFVDPETLAIKGDLIVYGTSGILPFRTKLDYLHRSLLLGEFGRYYSELAASWLWVATLGGVLLWWWRRTARKADLRKTSPAMRTRRLHGLVGVWIAVGLVFLSITGLTWSQWTGDRIDELRAALGWVTPSVSLDLQDAASAPAGEHADHVRPAVAPDANPQDGYAAQLDQIYAVTRAAAIRSGMIEIRPPRSAEKAWMVREYDRSWPTRVDTIAIDPRSMAVTSRADFETFPIVAKLVRWGIDLHMGILFGVASQIVMAALGMGLIFTIVYGYRIWWQRRPAPGSMPRTLIQSWTRLSAVAKGVVIVVAAALGWALPVLGISLAAFLAVDLVRWQASKPGKRTGFA